MAVQPTEVSQAPEHVRIHEPCEKCGRMRSKHSRKGYTWKCPNCDFVNMGPGYRNQDRTPPEGTVRRRTRRARRSEQGAGPDLPSSTTTKGSAPAPVRRKRQAAAAQAPKNGVMPRGRTAQEAVKPGSGPAAKPPRSILDRLFYGDGEE